MAMIIFLLILFVLILVHELGHFIFAKLSKMRVDEFGIGFPPRLFSIKRGETEYTFNLFPIGGFVKIYGEDSVGVTNSGTGGRSFVEKSKWAQSVVLLAGVTMNILFAWLLIAIAFNMGVQTVVSEEKAGPGAQLTITDVMQGSPAAEASLSSGAIIQKVQAEDTVLSVLSPSAFRTFVSEHKNVPITIAYTYQDELRVTQIKPVTGIIADNKEQPAIGVTLTQIDLVTRTFLDSIIDSFLYTLRGLSDVFVGIALLFFDAISLNADLSQVAGPVGIVGLVDKASTYGLSSLLMFTAFISINLAVINILPFPALDGGRLLFVIIESIKGSPIKPQYVAYLNTFGFFILILCMVAVTWNDIVRLIA